MVYDDACKNGRNPAMVEWEMAHTPDMQVTTKWQNWTSFALGLWLAVSPWLAGYADYEAATANAVLVGLALALTSHFECVACDEASAEWLNLAAGVWLVWAPFGLEFGSRVASANSVAVGVFVALLAASALSLDKHFGRLWHRTH